MKKILFLLLAIAFLTPYNVFADVAPDPGFHYYAFCSFIDNLDDFPNYDVYETQYYRVPRFVSALNPSEKFNGECGAYGDGENLGSPFMAVKKSNQAFITHKEADTNVDEFAGDKWGLLPENQKYFILSSVVDKNRESIKERTVGSSLPDSDPSVFFVSVYHITKLTDDSFDLSLVSESEYDVNEQLVSHSEKNTQWWLFDSFEKIVPAFLVIIGIGLILLATKKWKK